MRQGGVEYVLLRFGRHLACHGRFSNGLERKLSFFAAIIFMKVLFKMHPGKRAPRNLRPAPRTPATASANPIARFMRISICGSGGELPSFCKKLMEVRMKRGLLLIVALAFLAASIPVFAEYIKDVTVKAMRENYAGLAKAKTAAANSDFFAAADGLMAIAKNALMLSTMDPPKGDQSVWEATQKQLAMAAFKAIGACGNGDKAALDAALSEIVSTQMKGHGTFRG
jgi:hypothetical protein